MPRNRERARITLLIVVAVLAIALAMLEALTGQPDTAASDRAARVSGL
jgi:hypothetical protein